MPEFCISSIRGFLFIFLAHSLPLMEALAKRSTGRAFDIRDLSDQQMSDLLWAAFGINRPMENPIVYEIVNCRQDIKLV